MSASPSPQANPYPGLRPFREGEEALFFGREAQVDSLVDRLAATRFLAVVGTSGSGKSSLVNCGLVPALHRGLLAAAGGSWRVASLRPGNRPLRALAEALAGPGRLGAEAAGDLGFTPAEMMEATLRLSKLGLLDAVEQGHLGSGASGENLLVVVDQFEELFRYRALAASAGGGPAAGGAAAGEEATAFVNLLLEAGLQRELPLWVVITMRSDFLGECAQFYGLPEAINRGQYLVPRMTREERRSAVAGPAGVAGAEVDPVLLTRLVNDVGDDPDQLSILQHALHRTWVRWQEDGGAGPLELRHYEAVGTMAHALNQHAEEAFGELAEGRERQLAEALFKAITDRVADARGTRRPTRLDNLLEIAAAGEGELARVIDVFRDPSRAFLMPPAGTALRPDTPVDISHESLMRVWERLRTWSEEEAQAAQTYRRLAETAELNLTGRAGLLRQPDLQFALDWRQRRQPTPAWAARYRAGFPELLDFLRRSEEAFAAEVHTEAARREEEERSRREAQRARRLKVWALPVILLFGSLIGLFLYLYLEERRARTGQQKAIQEARESEALAHTAQLRAEEALAGERRARNEQRELAQVYTEAAREAPALRQAVARLQEETQERSLVYLQFADSGQKGAVARLRTQLERSGYSAPGIEQVAAAPEQSEVRFFRPADAGEATSLAALLKGWGWGTPRTRFAGRYEAHTRLRQLEIWFARPDPAEIARLLLEIDGTDAKLRLAAGQRLQDRYTASPAAIAGALALFGPERIGTLTANGRVNALFFLTRTAPLAWDSTLVLRGRQAAARLRTGLTGRMTAIELTRFDQLLDSVQAGTASPPPLLRPAG